MLGIQEESAPSQGIFSASFSELTIRVCTKQVRSYLQLMFHGITLAFSYKTIPLFLLYTFHQIRLMQTFHKHLFCSGELQHIQNSARLKHSAAHCFLRTKQLQNLSGQSMRFRTAKLNTSCLYIDSSLPLLEATNSKTRPASQHIILPSSEIISGFKFALFQDKIGNWPCRSESACDQSK